MKWLAFLLTPVAFATEPKLLEWMNRIAQEQLAARDREIAAIQTVDAAEVRKKRVRARILELMGGLPDYTGPLNSRVTGTLDRGSFIIEKVIFDSLPRVQITANLYRPRAAGKYPAVLFPMGHWEQGKAAAQRMAANLAIKGFVVLAFDPLGQGERQQAYDERIGRSIAGGSTTQHFMAGAQSLLVGQSFARYRVWDAKRALDYLVSRPDVDGEKIGCTGCSGGGTVATYISALDARIKVAAPACYMNSFKTLFTGSVGDSEQSLPEFLSSGLDQTDYVELFAPKPWLIASTEKDFFTPAGAKQVFDEAVRWYGIYKAPERIKWVVGPGGHGTPKMVREAIYQWMIRWLKDGSGDASDQNVELVADVDLLAAEGGQAKESRDIYEVIRETSRHERSSQELKAELRRLIGDLNNLKTRAEGDTVRISADPGLEVSAQLYKPASNGKHPAVLLVDPGNQYAQTARQLAGKGYIVLAMQPRGYPAPALRPYLGDWLANTRSWLIGRNLPGMRARDILGALQYLTTREDVDAKQISAAATDFAGVWLLLAAASDNRFARVTLDRTPYSLRAALDVPVHHDLHEAVIPGFSLSWDLDDLVKLIGEGKVTWANPTDWLKRVKKLGRPYSYTANDSSADAVWMPPGL